MLSCKLVKLLNCERAIIDRSPFILVFHFLEKEKVQVCIEKNFCSMFFFFSCSATFYISIAPSNSATEVILSKVQLSMFLDVQIHKYWILSVMEGKNLEPFWSLNENGKFRRGNSNVARNSIIDILSIIGAIIFLLIWNWTLAMYIHIHMY